MMLLPIRGINRPYRKMAGPQRYRPQEPLSHFLVDFFETRSEKAQLFKACACFISNASMTEECHIIAPSHPIQSAD